MKSIKAIALTTALLAAIVGISAVVATTVLDRATWPNRPIRSVEQTAYTGRVISDMIPHQQNGIDYWDLVGINYTIQTYQPSQQSFNNANQIDLIFDALQEGDWGCYYDFYHCKQMPIPSEYVAVAQWWRFKDLNFGVVQWNATDFQDNPPRYPQVDGLPFYDLTMRHELGHDHFLADHDEAGYAGLMCNTDTCTRRSSATTDEASTASSEFTGRPQAPTSISVGGVTSNSIQVSFSGASGADTLRPYKSTTFFEDSWTTPGDISASATSYTFTGLSPNTTYYLRVASRKYNWGMYIESSSWWVTATTSSQPTPSPTPAPLATPSWVKSYFSSTSVDQISWAAVPNAHHYRVCTAFSPDSPSWNCGDPGAGGQISGTSFNAGVPGTSFDNVQWYNKVKACNAADACGSMSSKYTLTERAYFSGWNYAFTFYRDSSDTSKLKFQFINFESIPGYGQFKLKLHLKNGSSVGEPYVTDTSCISYNTVSSVKTLTRSDFSSILGTVGHDLESSTACGTSHVGDAQQNRWGYRP